MAPGCASLDVVNGGFEEPDAAKFMITDQEGVPGWSTSASDGKIEIWQSGYLGVPAAEGEQFAELAANEPSRLYQDLSTTPGQVLFYRLFHRGRNGEDTMEIDIGPPGGLPTETRQVSTSNTAWQHVVGRYTVPATQTTTRFGFRALSNASGSPSEGNFIDGVLVAEVGCAAVVLQTALVPKTDSGRFALLVNGTLAGAAAGDGTTIGPIVVPAGRVTVSERAAGGTRDADYSSAIQCRSNAGRGPVLSSAAAREVSFDAAATDVVACVLLNVHRHKQHGLLTPPPRGAGAEGLDLGTQVIAVDPRVRAGSTARFLVRVTNRGALDATNVRIVHVLRGPGSQVHSLDGGPCVEVRGGGACQITQLAAGRSTEIELSVLAAGAGRLQVAAIATASEPERSPADNLDRAAVTVTPRPAHQAPPGTKAPPGTNSPPGNNSPPGTKAPPVTG